MVAGNRGTAGEIAGGVIDLPSATRFHQLGLVLVTGSAVAWSTTGFFTRLIPLDVWTLLFWRGVIGALGLALVILHTERKHGWRRTLAIGSAGWLFAIVSAIGMILFITALRETTVAHVSVIYATVPFMAAGLGWVTLRERASRRAMLASLVALAGVAWMVGLSREGTLWGDTLAVGTTFCMAAMMVIAKAAREVSVMPAAALSALLSGLACGPMGHPFDISTQQFGLLLMFGLLNSAIGLSLFTFGARWLPPIETALIGALDAPLAPFWVWLAFGEAPGRATLGGGLVVFAAVAVHVILSARGERKSSGQPV